MAVIRYLAAIVKALLCELSLRTRGEGGGVGEGGDYGGDRGGDRESPSISRLVLRRARIRARVLKCAYAAHFSPGGGFKLG